jgi:hypothetical protein
MSTDDIPPRALLTELLGLLDDLDRVMAPHRRRPGVTYRVDPVPPPPLPPTGSIDPHTPHRAPARGIEAWRSAPLPGPHNVSQDRGAVDRPWPVDGTGQAGRPVGADPGAPVPLPRPDALPVAGPSPDSGGEGSGDGAPERGTLRPPPPGKMPSAPIERRGTALPGTLAGTTAPTAPTAADAPQPPPGPEAALATVAPPIPDKDGQAVPDRGAPLVPPPPPRPPLAPAGGAEPLPLTPARPVTTAGFAATPPPSAARSAPSVPAAPEPPGTGSAAPEPEDVADAPQPARRARQRRLSAGRGQVSLSDADGLRIERRLGRTFLDRAGRRLS